MATKRKLTSDDEAFLHKFEQDTNDYYGDISSKLLLDDWKSSKITEKNRRHILNYCQDKINYGLKETEQKNIQLETPFTLLIAGKTKCGKTHLLLHILRHWRYFTDDVGGFFTKKIYWFYGTAAEEQMSEVKEIFDGFRTELHDEEEQPTLHFQHADFKSEECKRLLDNIENAIIVLDDLMVEMSSTPQLASYFTRESHHKKICLIYLWQDIFPKQQFACSISKNTDYKILFDNPAAVKSVEIMLYQMFGKSKASSIFRTIQDYFLNSKKGSYPHVLFNVKPNQDSSTKIILDAYSDRSTDNIKFGVLSKPIETVEI